MTNPTPPGLEHLTRGELAEAYRDADQLEQARRGVAAWVALHPFRTKPGAYVRANLDLDAGAFQQIPTYHRALRSLADVRLADTTSGGRSDAYHNIPYYLPSTGWLAAVAQVTEAPETFRRIPPLVDFGAGATITTTEKIELTTTVPATAAFDPTILTAATGANIPLSAFLVDPNYMDVLGNAMVAGVDRRLEAELATRLATGATPMTGTDPFPAMVRAAAAAGDRLADIAILAGSAAAERIAEALARVALIGNLYVSDLVADPDLAYVAAPRGVGIYLTPAMFTHADLVPNMTHDLAAYRMCASHLRAAGALQVLDTGGV